MGDYHKVHEPNFKKYYKDKREGSHGLRQPTILTKPDRDRGPSLPFEQQRPKDKMEINKKQSENGQQQQQQQQSSQPTIILRPREGEATIRAVSPNPRPVYPRRDDSLQSSPSQQSSKSSSSPDSNTSTLTSISEMKTSMKLIDENFQFCENALEYLLDYNDQYLVVGCFGMQGSGKSTLMSMIAGNDYQDMLDDNLIFKAATSEQNDMNRHCTNGVDLHVTFNRIILLDTQPILSASMLDKIATYENKKLVNEIIPFENQMEILSLQLVSFLLSVCHVVILVQDWFFDPNILRFIQTAEMLKPSTHTTSQDEEIIEYFPQVLFYHNKAQPSEFEHDFIKKIQELYVKSFTKSQLEISSGIGCNVMPNSSVNMFLYPSMTREEENETKDRFKGHSGVSVLMSEICLLIYGARRQQLTQTTLSEKNWFHFAVKVWDGIKKSNFFLEYSKMMP